MKKIQTKKINQGLSIHCHHDTLAEYCYDYDARVQYIQKTKPSDEIELRLKLFKILPQKALREIPEKYQKADAKQEKSDFELKKVNAKLEKAYAEWKKAYAEWEKAYAEWKKADAEWKKAYAEWPQESKDQFHKKWCGCEFYKNGTIVFPAVEKL